MKKSGKATVWSAVAGLAFVAGSAFVVHAGESATGTVLVPTVPERALDTRLAGPISTLGPSATETFSFAGLVPAGAKAVEINVTIVDGSETSFLSLWPTGGDRPIVSVLNWTGPAPDANSVAVKLGKNQSINMFNRAGTVNVILDLMGYYVDAPISSGQAGPVVPVDGAGVVGPVGPAGPAGPVGPVGSCRPAGACRSRWC